MKLTVVREDSTEEISVRAGESIYESLTRHNIYLTVPCGGKGICGKCRIQLLEGNLNVTKADYKNLTGEQIEQGVRLACRAYPTQNIKIRVWEEEPFEVVTSVKKSEVILNPQKKVDYGVAVDIGTTTIAMELVDRISGKPLKSIGQLNRQRSYGADVISRISACNDGKQEKLTNVIRTQLVEMIEQFQVEQISKIVIAANTTMCHILMGYDCVSLGKYPFEPVNIETIYIHSQKLFGTMLPSCEVLILPGISTYVGADIVSGLVYCGFADAKKVCAMIDLGTNGEVAIGTKDRIVVTSAAAGPAFEGGNISCGTGSIPGAISEVEIRYGMAKVKTIKDKEPVGICGSGVIDLTAELLQNKVIDGNGTLIANYFEDGFPVSLSRSGEIVFFQEDVREIQMAKSAIYSALTLLVKHYGITMEEVDKVYLAGGFGFHVNIEKAVRIGLFPEQWKEKIEIVGNTALKGAELALGNGDFLKRAKAVVNVSKELVLATDREFSELYTANLFFEHA